MPVPTRRLVLVALGLAAVRLGLPDDLPLGIVGLNAVLAVLVVLDYVACTAPRRIPIGRELPAAAVVGQPVPGAWIVVNPTRRRLRLALADELAPSLHASRRRAAVTLPGRGSVRASFTLTPSRRGRFEPGVVTVRVEGPLGLVARQQDRWLPASMAVHPPFRSREEAELRIRNPRVLQLGLRLAQLRGGGTEFDALREYGPDDDFRRVDWAATARTNTPIVRTYRTERNQSVLVLVDAGRSMAGLVTAPWRPGGEPEPVARVEHATDAALTLATVGTRLGDRVGLATFASQVDAIVAPSADRSQPSRMADALFDLEPELIESDYQGAFATITARFRRRSLLVLLTDLKEQAALDHLLPALPILTKNHLLLVGAVRDPEVARWAEVPVEQADDAHRRAAAVVALDRRAALIARLESLGVIVVDAIPGRLGMDLADTYLRLKSDGRL